jgi:hypothetical protein
MSKSIDDADALLARRLPTSKSKYSSKYCPHEPYPKQQAFLACQDIEAMYGGAAGGGKSDALLMAALQYVDQPKYNALLLRRTFRDLNQPEAIMARAHEWLRNTPAVWNAQDKRYTFPRGATLTFGYLDTENDKDQYASAEFQYIGFDELTQFPEKWYTWLFSRLRKTKENPIPLRMRSGTNPGGIGHVWVKERFVDGINRQGTFFPAFLTDNPHIDQEGYLASLEKLDANTRAQLKDGIWILDSSGLVYYCYNAERNNVYAYPLCTTKILGLDFGASQPTALVSIGWRPNDATVYILKSWKQGDIEPYAVAQKVKEWEETDKFEQMIGDIGGLGKGYQLELRRHHTLPIEAADKNNKLGYIKLIMRQHALA